jgi:predicted transcriptional regulator
MSEKPQEWKKVNILKEQHDLIGILLDIPYVKATYAKSISEFTHISIAEKIRIIIADLKEKLPEDEYSKLFKEKVLKLGF